jgi:signal transduction histidine kinase
MPDNQKLNKLKTELLREAGKKVVDFGKVILLSTELAKHDPNFVRFSVDAGIISRLGQELVARQETALGELIKNAYDADALEVDLTFENAEKAGGRLEIIDNGLGMDRNQLIDGFMRLSSTEKLREPISPRYKRRRAGRKGIGRFAVERLGRRVQIITQKKEADKAYKVAIDWADFGLGKELATIANRIQEIPKRREEGTTLIIENLREEWPDDAIKEVYRYVAELTQPFTLRDKRRGKKLHATATKFASEPETDFKVVLKSKTKNEITVIADEQTEILSNALAVIEGYVDHEGFGYWSVVSEKLGINEPILSIGREQDDNKSPFLNLRDIDFRAYYFIQNVLLPRQLKPVIHKLLADRGGIHLYRNGFRVRPYGEADNDWLGLDASYRARVFLPPHANNNFFGFVEIIDPDGRQFNETSGRERIVENKSFEELTEFVSRVVKAAAQRVAAVRGKKIFAGQKNWDKKNPAEKIRNAALNLSRALEDARATKGSKKADPSFDGLLEAAEETVSRLRLVAKEQEELLQEIGMLRVLASLGLIIGEFTHEVTVTLGAAELTAKSLAISLKRGTKQQKDAEDLRFNVSRFRTYASYFDDAVADNVSRELYPENLRVVVKRFIDTVRPAASAVGIKTEPPIFDGASLTTRPMHSSELASILFNLYSNAHKAIVRAGVQGKILLRAGHEGANLYLDFADNGDGVPSENVELIFRAFFTTSSPPRRRSRDEQEFRGTGLGLKIVKDIVEGYDGAISLIEPPKTYSTCFRIIIPAATEEQLREYGYKISLP